MKYRASTLIEVVVASVLAGMAFVLFLSAYLTMTTTTWGPRHHRLMLRCDSLLTTVTRDDWDGDVRLEEADGFTIRLEKEEMRHDLFLIHLTALDKEHTLFQRHLITFWP